MSACLRPRARVCVRVPLSAGSEDPVVCGSYYCRDKSGPSACCCGGSATHISLSHTNTFPRTVKFSLRRRHEGRRRLAVSLHYFPKISSKVFGEVLLPSFFYLSFYFSIYFCFFQTDFRQWEVSGVSQLNMIHSQVSVVFFSLLFTSDILPTTVA